MKTRSPPTESGMIFAARDGLLLRPAPVPERALAVVLPATTGEGGPALDGPERAVSDLVAEDQAGPDAIWVAEVWDRVESHRASLACRAAQDAIGRARQLLAGFGQRSGTRPVAGHGLSAAA